MIEDCFLYKTQPCGDPQNTFVLTETYPTLCTKMKDEEFWPGETFNFFFIIITQTYCINVQLFYQKAGKKKTLKAL